TTAGDSPRHGLVRFTADGALDASFADPGLDNSSASYLGANAVVIDSTGGIIVGGSFASVNGTRRHGLARFNSDGTLDTAF
ncbi:delta-60 repeat domain-containing protein, partial [Klebsiella pneumoniae]|uniref:delta-60 repeat domain-containing protein n=1 Tax=Klebsiella pneumoniae TaxID=573 RepID=UPI00385316F7